MAVSIFVVVVVETLLERLAQTTCRAFLLLLFLFAVPIYTDIFISFQCIYCLRICMFLVDWSDRLLSPHWEFCASWSGQDRLNGRNLHKNSDKDSTAVEDDSRDMQCMEQSRVADLFSSKLALHTSCHVTLPHITCILIQSYKHDSSYF